MGSSVSGFGVAVSALSVDFLTLTTKHPHFFSYLKYFHVYKLLLSGTPAQLLRITYCILWWLA